MIATTLTSRQAARPGAGVTPQSQAILRPAGGLTSVQPVSYTHLTLPTSDLV